MNKKLIAILLVGMFVSGITIRPAYGESIFKYLRKSVSEIIIVMKDIKKNDEVMIKLLRRIESNTRPHGVHWDEEDGSLERD